MSMRDNVHVALSEPNQRQHNISSLLFSRTTSLLGRVEGEVLICSLLASSGLVLDCLSINPNQYWDNCTRKHMHPNTFTLNRATYWRTTSLQSNIINKYKEVCWGRDLKSAQHIGLNAMSW